MRENFFKIRNYRPEDFAYCVHLHREAGRLDGGGGFNSEQRLTESLGHPSFHPETDLFIAESGRGIIGSTSVFLEKTIKRAILNCLVHPRHRKKGVATALVRDALRHAENKHARRAQVCIPESNLTAKTCAPRLGFTFIRRFIEFQLDLGKACLQHTEPIGYTVRHLEQDEIGKLTAIQNRSFADSWGFNPNTVDEIAYRTGLRCCTPENIILADAENKPIGYCWTQIMNENDRAGGGSYGEIHMLGVDPDFRRRGVGRTVLLAGLSHLKRKGVSTVRLTADSEEPAALGLYESVGFEICSRSEWYQKKLS